MTIQKEATRVAELEKAMKAAKAEAAKVETKFVAAPHPTTKKHGK